MGERLRGKGLCGRDCRTRDYGGETAGRGTTGERLQGKGLRGRDCKRETAVERLHSETAGERLQGEGLWGETAGQGTTRICSPMPHY